MELDQKVKYAFVALTLATVVLAAVGVHLGLHMKAFEGGGNAD